MMVAMDDGINPRWSAFRDLPNHPEMSVFPDRPPRIRHQDTGGDHELACPKCKHNLRGPPGLHCPECGLEVEYEPITVFTAADLSLVWAAAMVLDQNQITNMIVTGSYDAIVGMFSRLASLPHLMAPFKYFHEAVQLLDARFGRREFKNGEQPPPPPPMPSWCCPACQTENPGSFEVCWQCSSQHSELQDSGQ